MLTSPGSEAQRAFLVEAFAHAQTLANMGLSNMAEGQSADATQAFEWLYGTTDVPMMRAAARCTFLAQQKFPFLLVDLFFFFC